MKRVKVFIEKTEDGYSAYVDLEDTTLNYGIIGEGATVSEALEDFRASYEDMKAIYKEEGRDFVEADFEFLYDLPSFLQYYSKIFSFAGLERLTEVNQAQLSQYVQGYRKPSKQTVVKIKKKINHLAEELQDIQFV